ncbi:MAG: ABC transporter permease subunit [Ardenticatenales bacterium]|nr:ABC transporter permease subunit [Ardenticatenales bacterium]
MVTSNSDGKQVVMAAETPRRSSAWKMPGVNPILIKELRSRMRGPRAFLILTGFLLFLSAVLFLLYKTMEEAFRYAGPVQVSATMGLTMFLGIAFFELFLVTFITPALTAGTISSERESLTYEMLLATPLRPASILLGKMVAALSYVFLLIFAAVPMLSLVFIFGGVTLRDMAVALLFLAVATITFGTIGVFWSALLGRTGRATVMSYLTLLLLIMGPYFIYFFWGVIAHRTPPPALLYPNPFTAMISIVDLGQNGMNFMGGFAYFLFNLLTGGMGFGGPQLQVNHPAWHWTLALYSMITLVLGLATILLVRPVGRRRVTVPQAVLALLLIVAMIASFTMIFQLEDWKQIWSSPDQMMEGFKG